ncbi:hypothetical protein BC941DRAFT_435941 [Chlamydoabsidia padenii]|nr:hypothetical protein BC941DRAFT_435941 [Chlamydoabsidia padenii]
MKFSKKLLQSKTVEDNDVLSYHFKEQCKIQRRINATMPHLRSLHTQPSVCVKANGAIVLKKNHHAAIPSDWISSDEEEEEEEETICGFSISDTSTHKRFSREVSSPSIFRSSSLPTVLPQPFDNNENPYKLSYEQKIGILLEEMDDVQREGMRMKEQYHALEQRHQRLEQTLAERDQFIHILQSQLESLMHT